MFARGQRSKLERAVAVADGLGGPAERVAEVWQSQQRAGDRAPRPALDERAAEARKARRDGLAAASIEAPEPGAAAAAVDALLWGEGVAEADRHPHGLAGLGRRGEAQQLRGFDRGGVEVWAGGLNHMDLADAAVDLDDQLQRHGTP